MGTIIEAFRQAEAELVKEGFLFRRRLGDPAQTDLAAVRGGEDDVRTPQR